MKTRIPVTAAVSAIILAVIMCVAAAATDIPSPTDSFYVYDGADVLDKSVESYIIERNGKLAKHTGAQIVVVTVDSTGDTPINDFASEIFNKWKIGDPSEKNGLLILLAIDDENYWVSQGNGLEKRLTTSSIKAILDSYLEPYFASGNYSKGVQTVFNKFISSFEKIYSVDLDDTALAKTEEDNSSPVFVVVAIIVVVVVFIGAVIVVVRKFSSNKRYTPLGKRSKPTYRTGSVRRVNSVQPVRRPAGTPHANTGGRRPVQKSGARPSSAQRPGARPAASPGTAQRNGSRPGARPSSPSGRTSAPNRQVHR